MYITVLKQNAIQAKVQTRFGLTTLSYRRTLQFFLSSGAANGGGGHRLPGPPPKPHQKFLHTMKPVTTRK